jgi:hypothetical protein
MFIIFLADEVKLLSKAKTNEVPTLLEEEYYLLTLFSSQPFLLTNQYYYSNYSKLYKYNYTTNSVEGSTELNSSSIVFVKVFESSFGTLLVNTGSEIKCTIPI